MSALLSLLVLDPRLRPWRYRLALFLYLMILAMGSVPGARADIGLVASGIVLHSLAYGTITFLLFTGSTGSLRQCAIKSVATVAAMGAFDEIVQGFLPYRHGTLADWAVDLSAALLTAALLWAAMHRRSRAT